MLYPLSCLRSSWRDRQRIRAALHAVAIGRRRQNARVAFVCGEPEDVAALLHAALGKAAAENIVIDEVLP